MSDTAKRELDGEQAAVPAAKKLKAAAAAAAVGGSGSGDGARLGDDRVAAMPVGSNLIEEDGKSCTHEVCWPPGVQGSNDPPKARQGPSARDYPFTLDPFQQTAINALEAGACSVVRCVAGWRWGLVLLDTAHRVQPQLSRAVDWQMIMCQAVTLDRNQACCSLLQTVAAAASTPTCML